MIATQPQLSSQPPDFFPQVQPRPSSERDNSILLHAALKAASTDMAHRLLDYASFDKVDCEASCILIALANHDDEDNNDNDDCLKSTETEQKEPDTNEEKVTDTALSKQEKPTELSVSKEPVTQTDHKKPSKSDPMMLLMAAAEVVNRQSSEEKRREYPNGRYYHRKSSDEVPSSQHYLTKRMRPVSPPPPPSATTIPEKKKYRTDDSSTMIKDTSTTTVPTNSFSKQYHSMKQNPKIKQNALHTYITYMIYNDLAHHGGMRKQVNQAYPTSASQPPPPPPLPQQQRPNEYRGFTYGHPNNPVNDSSHPYPMSRPSNDTNMITPSSTADNSSWFSSSSSSPNIPPPPPSHLSHDERSILSRPLTAFLWDAPPPSINTNSKMMPTKEDKKDMVILPPLTSKRPSSNNIYDRLPPL